MKHKREKMSAATAIEVIDRIGGTTATASIMGIPVQTVDSWRKNGVPKWREPQLMAAWQEVIRDNTAAA